MFELKNFLSDDISKLSEGNLMDPVKSFDQHIELQKFFESKKEEILKAEYEGKLINMENKAITAQEELEKLKKTFNQIEEENSKLKISELEGRKKINEIEHKYKRLTHALFLRFGVSTIEEVLRCGDKILEYENKIDLLQNSNLELCMKLNAEKIKGADNVQKESNINLETLNEKIENANKTISEQEKQIYYLKSQCETILTEKKSLEIEISKLKIQTKEFQQESKGTNDVNEKLLHEIKLKSEQIDDAQKRLRILSIVSQRLNPDFLSINETSNLHPIYSSISKMLKDVSDIDANSKTISESLVKVSEAVQSMSMKTLWNNSLNKANEKIKQLSNELNNLKKSNEDLEEQLNESKEEIKDLRNEDKIPYLLSIIKSKERIIKDLENKNRELKANKFGDENTNSQQLFLPKKKKIQKFLSSPRF